MRWSAGRARLISPALAIACAFALAAGCAAPPEPPTRYPAAERLVAIGDLHGDLAAAHRALLLAGAIDAQDRWTGGDLVVVQTGDQLDRGNDEPEILDLLERLAAEAAQAGGAVLALNGNHELMNVKGDMRYVTSDGFADFAAIPLPRAPAVQILDFPARERRRRAAFAPGGPVALRLARRNVVAIVGDTLFVHGGVLPHVAAYGIERLNREARDWVRGERAEPPGLLLARNGPVWARHYCDEPDPRDCRLLSRTLRPLGARRMVVGHTIQEGGIRSFCDDLVWCIDTGMSAHYGGRPAALEITGGKVHVLTEEPPTAPPG
ncbi:MAG: metallophosphoesterase [Acidobacteriota bacterium]